MPPSVTTVVALDVIEPERQHIHSVELVTKSGVVDTIYAHNNPDCQVRSGETTDTNFSSKSSY